MKSKALLVLAGFALLASTGAARADADFRQVWYDSEGQVVHNTWGTCVRSRWNVDHDPCAYPPEKVKWERKHTIIAEEARTVYFAFDKTDLTDESKQRLNTLAERMTSADDITGAKIVGYADRIGTSSYNMALSQRRAETVRGYLVSQGFIKPSTTETRWVGKSRPSTNCSNDLPREKLLECLQPDRKVQVDVVYKAQTDAER